MLKQSLAEMVHLLNPAAPPLDDSTNIRNPKPHIYKPLPIVRISIFVQIHMEVIPNE